jgi:hypothetical protein
MSRPKLELSGTQLVASALATTTAALAASKLGAVGTLWGAAVTSVVTTGGIPIYKYYLEHGKQKLIPGLEDQAGVPQPDPPPPYDARPLGADPNAEKTMALPLVGDDDDPYTSPSEKTLAYGSLVRGDPETMALPVVPESSTTVMRTISDEQIPDGQSKRRPHWHLLAAAAVAVFALVMGGITVAETIMGNSIAATVNNEQDNGTTLGGGETPRKNDQKPVIPSDSPTPKPTPTKTKTKSTPSPTLSPSAPAPTPTVETPAPTTSSGAESPEGATGTTEAP